MGFFVLLPYGGTDSSGGTTFFPFSSLVNFPFGANLPVVVPSYSSLLLSVNTSNLEPLDFKLVTGAFLVPFLTCLDEKVFFGGMVPAFTPLLVSK